MMKFATGWMLLLAVLASPVFALQDVATEPEQSRAVADSEPADSEPAGSEPADAMAWRLQEGQRFTVEFSTLANIDTQVDTRIRKVEVETRLVFDWEVVEVKPTATVIKQVLQRIKLESGTPGDVSGGRLSFDSSVKKFRKGISARVTKQYRGLIGLSGQFEISKTGVLSNFVLDEGQQTKLMKLPEDSPVKALFKAGGIAVLSDSTSTAALQQGGADVQIDFDQAGGFLSGSIRKKEVTEVAPYRDLEVKTATKVETRFSMKEVK